MLYRIHIKMGSGIIGNLDSNTMFGLFCSSYKIKYGNDELEFLLECLKCGEDDVVFSNPLYKDTFNLMNYEYRNTSIVLIDRENPENNELMLNKVKGLIEFDILLYSTLPIEKLKDTFNIARILGLGSKKSSGYGNIKEIVIETEDESKLAKEKIVRNLSNIFPSEDTTTHGEIGFTTRYGKTIDGLEQKPIIMIKAGSELLNTGKIITGTYVYDKDTCTYIQGKSILV